LVPLSRSVTISGMSTRIRKNLGLVAHACGLCGGQRVMLVESRRVRRLADRLHGSWDPHLRLTEVCQDCAARTRVDNVVALLPAEWITAADGGMPVRVQGPTPLS
jgi:hypothetical protein